MQSLEMRRLKAVWGEGEWEEAGLHRSEPRTDLILCLPQGIPRLESECFIRGLPGVQVAVGLALPGLSLAHASKVTVDTEQCPLLLV